jgi:hypothetical protein
MKTKTKEQVFNKWKSLLSKDAPDNISYGRSVLVEMLTDFYSIADELLEEDRGQGEEKDGYCKVPCPQCQSTDTFSVIQWHHKCRKCGVRYLTDVAGDLKSYASLDETMERPAKSSPSGENEVTADLIIKSGNDELRFERNPTNCISISLETNGFPSFILEYSDIKPLIKYLSQFASLKSDTPFTSANYMKIRELTDEEWMKLPKEEILQLYKNCYKMLMSWNVQKSGVHKGIIIGVNYFAEDLIKDEITDVFREYNITGCDNAIIDLVKIYTDKVYSVVPESDNGGVSEVSEQDVKEFVGIIWKDTANAFRMYPDNKHTFSDFWSLYSDYLLTWFKSRTTESKKSLLMRFESRNDKYDLTNIRNIDISKYLETLKKEHEIIVNEFLESEKQ